jgi:hypothetical protein
LRRRSRRRAALHLSALALIALAACDTPAPAGTAPSAASASASAKLDQAAVDAVVASHVAELSNDCLGAHAPLELQLILEVDAEGKVLDAATAGGGAAEKEIRACIDERMKSWRFPGAGKQTTLTASLSLTR